MISKLNTVGSSTYLRLKNDIIFGVLEPGKKLKLNTLRDQYEASLSTLRETLNRLTSEGFVAAEEQRGFFVTPISKIDLQEVATMRILLECFALEESIKGGDADWEGDLVAAHHKLRRVEDRMLLGDYSDKELWKRLDWEFHLALIQACNNKNLLALHAVLYDKYLRYMILVVTFRGEEAFDEHRTMFEAALSRDTGLASDTLRRHVNMSLFQTLDAMPD
ncbi:MAG: GntR family transcriptional regulator [Alphaproteobacteria bacterium TMED89]|nr:GntR family transcriptional regulator [Rhodospirillaceae bacterium]RPH15145.1 MAG: GntR family transcriptional regulator [Alphaproteobacteria bacterium TMED89]